MGAPFTQIVDKIVDNLRPLAANRPAPGCWFRLPVNCGIPDHRRGEAAMAPLEGRCEPRFEAVRGALARHLDSGEELGASLVVDIDGDLVVDLWGGSCDQARTVPWTEHTITNVWSSTKTVTSLAALMLVDRGEIGSDRSAAYGQAIYEALAT